MSRFFLKEMKISLFFRGVLPGKILEKVSHMSVLILKNVPNEGPGTIEDFLRDHDMPYRIIEMYSEELPHTETFDALVIMGGPMSVHDTDRLPHLRREIELAEEFMLSDKSVFGVCLGAQVMAKALGSRIYRGSRQEIGWCDIEIENNGMKDPLITKLAMHPVTGDFNKKFKVFQWHGETFDIPKDSVSLARSDLYPQQAFRYRNNAYAFQFHIEVKKEMIYEWFKNNPHDIDTITADTESFCAECTARAMNFYEAFFISED